MPPRIPSHLLAAPALLPCLAAISPVALGALVWVAGGNAGWGAEGVSRTVALGIFVWAIALGVSMLAVVRAKDRVERILGLVGLVGNVLLLVVGLLARGQA
jgi:hypothetical protein